MSLVPVPSEQPETTCAGCGAALVPDQRYCLSCGQPVSPVRLAFLDVLQADPAAARAAVPGAWQRADATVLGYNGPEQAGAGAWLRRNTGLLSLGAVLLLCLVVGLLVGHWTQGTSHSPQVVKIEGLSGLGAAGGTAQPAAGSTASPTASGAGATTKSKEKKEEAQAAKEAAKETKAEKAPPPPPVKASPQKLQKLTQSTGKKHTEELNALGAQPIETG
jgi:hypothetical protein